MNVHKIIGQLLANFAQLRLANEANSHFEQILNLNITFYSYLH